MDKKSSKKKPSKPIKTIEHGQIAALIREKKAPGGFVYLAASVGRITKKSDKGVQISSDFFDYQEAEYLLCVKEACNYIRETNLERSQPTQVAA